MNLTSGSIAHLHELSVATDEKTSPLKNYQASADAALAKPSYFRIIVWPHGDAVRMRPKFPNSRQLNHHIGQESWRHGMVCHVCILCVLPCVPLHIVPVQSSFLGEGHTVPRGAEGQVLQRWHDFKARRWHDDGTFRRVFGIWGHWGYCDPSGQQPMEQFCDLSAASAGNSERTRSERVLSSQRARAADTCLAQRYDATMFSIQLKQSMLYNIKSVYTVLPLKTLEYLESKHVSFWSFWSFWFLLQCFWHPLSSFPVAKALWKCQSSAQHTHQAAGMANNYRFGYTWAKDPKDPKDPKGPKDPTGLTEQRYPTRTPTPAAICSQANFRGPRQVQS